MNYMENSKNENMRYNAFISYSHADCGNIAAAIQKALENIGKPWYRLKRNLTVFRDETNLAASPELWNSIVTAIDNADNLILLASPIAKESFWINKEIEHWLSKERTGRLYIILSQGKIVWDYNSNDFDWGKTNCLPKILQSRFKEEPLWIDLTSYLHSESKTANYKQPGFTSSITKVIGGIIGKPPREIESIELRSKRFIKAIIVFAFCLMAFLTIFAFVQQSVAKYEKNKAILSEKKAINNLKRFKLEEFEKNLRDARTYVEANELGFAKQALEKADSTAKDGTFNQDISVDKIRYIDSILNIINNNTR
jgi:hypothetical protein